MRRGYFTPPVLIILAIIIFAVAILIAINADFVKRLKKEPLPTPIISPSPISDVSREPTGSVETANWKSYINKKHQYSIKYPKDLDYGLVNQRPDNADSVAFRNGGDYSQFPENKFIGIGIGVKELYSKQTLQEYLEAEYPPNKYGIPSFESKSKKGDMEEIVIDTQKGFLSKTGMQFENTTRVAWVKRGTKLYEILAFGNGETGTYYSEDAGRIFNQILSTFQFID